MLHSPESHLPDPLAALRAATATRHHQLDSSLPLAMPDATLSDYVAHLRMVRAWLAPLQAWLDGFDDGPARADTGRLGLIDADLADAAVADADFEAAPPPTWPHDASPAWRWGVCYVIEGSQLGGAVLYARLRERLAPHPLRYLKGEEGGPGPRWRAFMLALRAQVRSASEIEEACAGACAAFDAMLALRR